MIYQKLLIVAKRSRYELLCKQNGKKRIDALVKKRDRAIRNILRSHGDHLRLLKKVTAFLDRKGIRYKLAGAFERRPQGTFDLILTLGGDGTFLWASHSVTDAHMLGINSTPRISIGVFCAADANNFKKVLTSAMEGRMPVLKLARIEAKVSGKSTGALALNDILFAHEIPAATSRYFLRIGDIEEEQRSSGVWIATAAGSTAAVRSAGGRIMPIESKRIQYIVREPFDKEISNLKGFIEPEGEVRIRAKMNHGRIFIDGAHDHVDVPFGGTVVLKPSAKPLSVLGIRRK
ncbi:NAD(+)/NADH kinase [Acidobacteriota bacterium]